MNVPNIISDLVVAQNKFNTIDYANCFHDDAVVFDEAERHEGKEAIKRWNEATNAKYKTQLEVLSYSETSYESIMAVKVYGTFDGSPIELKYHFRLRDTHIASLEITA